MIDARDYLKLIMKKKNITQAELVRRINELEQEHNEKRTRTQNLNEYLQEGVPFRPKFLVKIEVALGVPYGTLVNMVAPPLSKEGKRELEKWKQMYRK